MTKTFQHIKSGISTEVIRSYQHTSKYHDINQTLGKNVTINTRKYKNEGKDYPYYPV